MTRGRIKSDLEQTREHVEGDLAILGSARVLMELVADREGLAQQTGQTSVLRVCGEDLQRCERLINRVQTRIRKRFEEDLK
jgi:hypothetical protein